MWLVKSGGRAFPALLLATVVIATIVLFRSALQHRPYALAQVEVRSRVKPSKLQRWIVLQLSPPS